MNVLTWLTALAVNFAPGIDGEGTLEGSLGPIGSPEICALRLGPPEYYAIDLVPTRQVVGTGRAGGTAHLTFDSSPFGVELAPDGSYRTTLHIQTHRLPSRDGEAFVVWATTPSIDAIIRIGELDEEGFAKGRVEWNKFLVVVTLEPEVNDDLEVWSGPIVMRGVSRSGRMHTMAGHGPFEEQECAAFGY